MSRPLLIIPLIGLLLSGAGSASATTLAEAVGAALALAEQTPRVTAARREADAIRTQAGSLVAQDPALRVKYLSDELTEGGGANEWEAMVDLPLWLPGQRGARREVAGALDTQAGALERLLRWEMAGRVRQAAWEAAFAEGRLRPSRPWPAPTSSVLARPRPCPLPSTDTRSRRTPCV
ncbi:MAG: hypothetical protein KFB96_16570 [Thiocapsa sp.]|uniref:hypothetical protein n=1 Tax=Thiocapsa sp. TaxID=2024551 RepID=UPI001BCEE7F7|nr:hypothetical protein [Thiocapsa sp.]QVL47317.1 MAG: hypothetical protein KFB96_16570 [Thiocapsa sp.]